MQTIPIHGKTVKDGIPSFRDTNPVRPTQVEHYSGRIKFRFQVAGQKGYQTHLYYVHNSH